MVAQIAQKSSASLAGWCVGFCCDEGVSDAVTLVTAEELASAGRWTCPNERTSCSAIAASASQLPHRLLVRTQRMARRANPLSEQSTAVPIPGNTFTLRERGGRYKLAGLLPECNKVQLANSATDDPGFCKRTAHVVICFASYLSAASALCRRNVREWDGPAAYLPLALSKGSEAAPRIRRTHAVHRGIRSAAAIRRPADVEADGCRSLAFRWRGLLKKASFIEVLVMAAFTTDTHTRP
jgi:hypothetical protein